MHGYGVACFTAKCRRHAAAPRRSPFTYSTSPLQPRLFLLPSLSRPTLLRHPRRGFLSSVSLCLPFPRRAVASSCATLLAYTLLAPCVHISIACSALSLAYRSLPRCMPRCIPLAARISCRSLATTESVGLQRVFSTSRGEPRSLRLTRADFRAALIALGAECGMHGFPSPRRRRYPPPVYFVSLA